MPTTRPRHTVTETEPVARALDDAARHWPQDRRARNKLLMRLIEEGHRAIQAQSTNAAERRRDAVEQTSGLLPGIYPPGYLAELRQDWPE